VLFFSFAGTLLVDTIFVEGRSQIIGDLTVKGQSSFRSTLRVDGNFEHQASAVASVHFADTNETNALLEVCNWVDKYCVYTFKSQVNGGISIKGGTLVSFIRGSNEINYERFLFATSSKRSIGGNFHVAKDPTVSGDLSVKTEIVNSGDLYVVYGDKKISEKKVGLIVGLVVAAVFVISVGVFLRRQLCKRGYSVINK